MNTFYFASRYKYIIYRLPIRVQYMYMQVCRSNAATYYAFSYMFGNVIIEKPQLIALNVYASKWGGGVDMVRLKHIYAKIHRIRFIFGYLVLVLHICINWVLEKSGKISRCSWVIFFLKSDFQIQLRVSPTWRTWIQFSNGFYVKRSHIEYN